MAVLSAMSARGLSFDHVLVPGLVERKFPALARPDPLLSDEERNDVARTTSRPLADKVFPRPDEERLLFAVCADAARQRLTLLAARRDASLDRERTPSQFFTRAVDAFEGGPSKPGSIPGRAAPPLSGRRGSALTARSSRAERDGGAAPDSSGSRRGDGRVDLSSSRAGPRGGEASRPSRVRPLRGTNPRRRPPGRRGRAALSQSPLTLGNRDVRQVPLSLLLPRVLRVRAFDEASERGEVDDLGRGSLFHDAARRIAWERRGVPFRSLTPGEASGLSRRHAAAALTDWEEENGYGLGPALVRELTEARLVEELEAWLDHERQDPANSRRQERRSDSDRAAPARSRTPNSPRTSPSCA